MAEKDSVETCCIGSTDDRADITRILHTVEGQQAGTGSGFT